MKRTAILQTASAHTDAAIEALDVALSLASLDMPVQLILLDDAVSCLHNPSKRYGMLEMLDAEPILVCHHQHQTELDVAQSSLDVAVLHPDSLTRYLQAFDEVLQFS